MLFINILIFKNKMIKEKLILILIFIFSFFIQIKTQTCGVANPNNFSDCEFDSSKHSICCYAEVALLNQSETLCVYVPKSQIFITPFISSMDIGLTDNNIEIYLNCGYDPESLKEGETYSICRYDPEKPEDCFQNSTENASCCYISNPDNSSVCLLNSGIYKKNENYFGIKVICNAFKIKILNNFWYFLLGLLIII
jgi:hypothetical protein